MYIDILSCNKIKNITRVQCILKSIFLKLFKYFILCFKIFKLFNANIDLNENYRCTFGLCFIPQFNVENGCVIICIEINV